MQKIIIANFKSNKSVSQTKQWMIDFMRAVTLGEESGVKVVVAPSLASVGAVSEYFDLGVSDGVSLGVQDLSPYSAGSYTGAVSTQNLLNLPVKYALVGHSERRRYFGETHQAVANKVTQALTANITPVVCIDDEYLAAQASAIDPSSLARCVVAYEPVEAIGNGENADVGEVKQVAAKVKAVFGDVPVLYGGSVDEQNILEYLLVCDGVLVGSASLDPLEFSRLVKQALHQD